MGKGINHTPVPVIRAAASPPLAGWIMSPNTWREAIRDTLGSDVCTHSNPITRSILRIYDFF